MDSPDGVPEAAEATGSQPHVHSDEPIPQRIDDPHNMYLLAELTLGMIDEQQRHPEHGALERQEMYALASRAIEASREHPTISAEGLAACERLRQLVNAAPPSLLEMEANARRLLRLSAPPPAPSSAPVRATG